MLFFALMIAIALVAAGVQFATGGFDLAASLRWGMALALIPIGFDHLRNPQRYLPMMPPMLPSHGFLVAFTGAFLALDRRFFAGDLFRLCFSGEYLRGGRRQERARHAERALVLLGTPVVPAPRGVVGAVSGRRD